MSADNYVAILRCTDGFRVIHCQAIENLYYWPTGRVHPTCKELRYNPDTNEETEHPVAEYEERTEINPDALRDYFGDSKFYKDEETAHKAAEKLIEHYGYVEYGIVTIYYDKEFPK